MNMGKESPVTSDISQVGFLDISAISNTVSSTCIPNISGTITMDTYTLSTSDEHSHQLYAMNRKQRNYSSLLETQGVVLGQAATCLLDDGATGDFIASSFVQKLHLTPMVTTSRQVSLAIKSESTPSQCSTYVTVSLALGSLVETRYFDVVDLDHYDIILGMPWHEDYNPDINWREKTVFVQF